MNQISKIDCPAEWCGGDDYSSHLPLLWLAISKCNYYRVVEFGCGHGSTNIIKKYCLAFDSVENDKEWANKFPGTIHIENYCDYNAMPVNVLFIDSKPGEKRKELIEKFKNDAQVIVVHDTEPSAEHVYGMKEILSTFKYRLDFQPDRFPHTTAVSNFINVAEWV